MILKVIIVVDKTNPIEVQEWFEGNPNIGVNSIFKDDNIFYILYN